MTDKPDTDQGVRDAITNWIKQQDDEDVIVLNYATVAEVIGPDSGEPWLKILSNPGMSSWARVGMAHALVQTAEGDLAAGWQTDDLED